MKKNYLLLLFLSTLSLLLILFIKERYPERIYKRIFGSSVNSTNKRLYLANSRYRERTSYFRLYMEPKKIVMLGDSHTEWIDWNELMQRDDIANRGISGDITAGFLNRLHTVFKLKPEICIVEGGINDLLTGIDNRTIIGNLKQIVDSLHEKKVKTVLCTATLVSRNRPDGELLNQKVLELNREMLALAKESGSPILDLNDELSEGIYRKSEYALPDGLHFTAQAYSVWKQKLAILLKEQGF